MEVISCLPKGMRMTESYPGLKLGPNPLIKNYSRLPFKYKFDTSTIYILQRPDLYWFSAWPPGYLQVLKSQMITTDE